MSVNTEDLTIAVATDPQGNVYTLSFGKGVDKRDADGKLLDDNFITGLKNPLDIAIDEDGLIYIADYEASGDTSSDNGQVKIFDANGNYLRSIWTSFYRPLGIDVDEENLYIAEYNDGQQGAERTPMSRVEIVDKLTGKVKESNSNISIPLRIAVNSQKQIYISKAGNDDPAVLILDQNLNILDRLPNITSPGSVVIDAFDYIHVIEYSGRVDFSDFINFESLGLSDIQSIAKAIDRGIDAEAFGVKIFSPNNIFQNFFKIQLDFPVDLAFNGCDRMYVDNADMFGNDTWLGYVPDRLEFDLEIYQRSPSADVTPPVAQCVGDFTIDLAAGEVRNFVAADFDNGSKDQCGEITLAVNKTSFSEADEGENPVTLTVTDEQGISSSCDLVVHVNVQAGPEPPEADCKDISVVLDNSGTASITAAQVYGGTDTALKLAVDISSFDCSNLGENKVELTVTDLDTSLSDSCTATVTVVDTTAPVANCVSDFTVTLDDNGTASITVEDLDNGSTDNCEIVSKTLSQYNFTSADVGVVPVTLTVADASGLSDQCTVQVTVKSAPNSVPPEADCKDISVVLDNSGTASITAAQVYGGTDTALKLAIDISSFDCSNLGENKVELTVTDPDTSLSDSCTATVTVVDTTAPVANCVSDFTVTLDDNGTASITVEDLDNGSTDNCEVVSKSLSQYNFTSADVGVVPVTLTVADASGLSDQCTVQVTVKSAPNSVPPEADCKDISVVLDNSGTASITAAQVYGGTDTALKLAVDISSFDCSNLGQNEVVLTVTDPDTSLSDSCTATVTVVDTTAPVANCVSDFTVTLDANGTASITAEDLDNGSTDNCEIVSKTLSQYDFTSADVGVVPVTLTVADASGLSDQCTVQVTVKSAPNSVPPEADCKDISVVLDGSGTASITADQVYGGTDTALKLAIDTSSFDCSNLGQNEVVLTVTDPDTGLSDSCTATVTVVDETNPEIICTPLTVQLNSQGTVTVTAEEVDGDSTDNCSISQMLLDRTSFGTEDIGQQKVKLTVRDGSGNEATCESIITVEPYEELPGGVICPKPATIALDEDGEVKGLRVKYDGSAELDFTVSPSYFNCADIGTHPVTVSWTGDYTGSCTSEVTIVDTTPPVLVCVANLDLRLNAAGTASISAGEAVETAYDNCGVDTMSLNKTVFTTADLGEQEVRLLVTDNSGNQSYCDVTINILPFEGETQPVQCAESVIVELDENGEGSINPRDLYSGGSGSIQFTLSKEDFSCDDVGKQTVNFAYTTPSGSGECDIMVEVRDPLETCTQIPPVEPPNDDIFLVLYPNPSHGLVEVIASKNIYLERAEVFDMRGRFLFSVDFVLPENGKRSYNLDLSELQSGVYNIKFISNDKEYLRRAIISND